uniref:PRA1 family protein n=1 Tax=Arcella intermedia TaxID=1963864 RepID=A0A6B2LKN6_9EUKA|eukprot:TRINITY_DN56_c0_g1_i1.p1 TRINITY_DN56_c0_g1~~TRINITY_DN56_c0_g1_i1.p1  ORF type:complete len:183 (-),score=38.36 TRINITY_DN56_c0_g1_i1:142-690(-)
MSQTAEPTSTSTAQSAANYYLLSTLQGVLLSWKDERFKTLRGGFFNRDKLSVPKIAEVPNRMTQNLKHFQTNYLLVLLALGAYSALASPRFLISLIFIGALWLYTMKWREGPLKIRDYEVPEKVVTLGLLLVTLLLVFLSSAGTILWWLITVTSAFVAIHAFFYTPDPDDYGFTVTNDTFVV